MKKNSMFKRFVAMLLCLTMVFGSVPVTFAVEEDSGYDQIADASTIDKWQNFFGAQYDNGSLTTENAGLVWTDKSVYTNETAPFNFNNVEIEENNFLVALSAMASNKEIVGYSTTPTDTVFILDLSQSMDSGRYIPEMVAAANDAIRELLSLNRHNRISVILYSGRSTAGTSDLRHAMVLLPLGRYVESGNNGFIRYTGWSNATTVTIARNLKNDNNEYVTESSKETSGGTYIQAGLYLAYKEFESVKDDTVIDSDLIQGGTTRMPIITLMSDGLPTTASTYYSNISSREGSETIGQGRNEQTITTYGVSTHGNGSGNNNTITFLTQLTAAHLKASVESWYGVDAKFYSLWLRSENESTANGTLQPSTSNDTLDGWWRTFLNAGMNSTVNFENGDADFSVTRDGVIPQITNTNYGDYKSYEEAWLDQQNYIDRMFNATDDDSLKSAFGDIVDEIIIQSKYYPTLVEGGEHNINGYITIEDPLGEFMEVKQIEGIQLTVGNRDILFTGAALTKHMRDNDFGSSTQYSENGWELIHTIEKRLGVNESTAIALATQAWNTKQLSYTSNTEFSNYIGWYCDNSRNYKGFWHEGHDKDDAPSGATKYVKSYGFFGEISDAGSNLHGTQMLYIAVHVETDLDDGDQTIYFSIPASLVPVMTYSVNVDSDSLATTNKATVKLTGATGPIRLLAEVGLRDDVNEITVAEKVAGRHHHTDENGNYVFYTNRWGKDDNYKPTTESIIQFAEVATTSHYQPSVQNDRYYYTENSIIYTDTNGTKYTGSNKPANGTFYHVIYRFDNTVDSASGKTGIHAVYEAIKPETLEFATQNADSTWYIPKGTPYREILTEYTLQKDKNATGTLNYVDSMYIYKNETNNTYEAYIFSGNNGKLSMASAQGIKLTKVIDVVEPNTDTSFDFQIAFTDADGNLLGAGQNVSYSYDGYDIETVTIDNQGYATISLDANEYVYVINPPAGATGYIVTEVPDKDYVPDYKGNNGDIVYSITGALTSGIVPVDFKNVPKAPGNLIISKTVNHPFGAGYTIPSNIEFDITVKFTLKGNTTAPEKIAVNGTERDYAGTLNLKIKPNESISIANLPDGTDYTVTETNLPNGFTLGDSSTGLSGTIASNTTSSAALVNNYTPASASGAEISITGTKNLVGREWKEGDSFTFALSQWNGTGFVDKTPENSTENVATYGNHNFSLDTAMDGVTFSEAGTYYFWITEVAAAIPGVTYDSTYRPFSVTVDDTDMDGKLEITDVSAGNTRVTVTSGTRQEEGTTVNTWAVYADFTNVYAPEGSASAEVRIIKNIEKAEGVNISLAGFQFAIYDEAGNPVGSPYTTTENGFAEIKLVYGPESLKKVYVDAQGNEYNELPDNANESDFNIRYKNTEYNYTVREITPDEADRVDGMTYTTDYAELTVTLSDDKNGGITAETVYSFVDNNQDNVTDVTSKDLTIGEEIVPDVLGFTNKYELDPTEVILHGEKTIEGRDFASDKEFTFELYQTESNFNVTGNPVQTVDHISIDSTNGNHGRFVFEPLKFADEHLNTGTFYYVVKEANGGKTIDGVTYTTDEYRITINVVQEDNTVKATVSSMKIFDGTATADAEGVLSFTNVYTVTGEAEATIEATKKLTGRDILEGEFAIEITDESGNSVEVKNTGKNFSHKFKFESPGTYVYTVKEKTGDLGGITYDDTEYTFIVFVYDNGKGKLKSESWMEDADGNVINEMVFNNTYSAENAQVTVKGKKVLEGKELIDGQFNFNLYSANENFTVTATTPIMSTTNRNGEFSFSTTYSSVGDYYYVVYEDASSPIENIDYDESEYQIHVHVFDNARGKLQSVVKVNDVVNGEIVFNNKYEKPEEPEKPVSTTKLTVEKFWKDKNDKEGERPDYVTLVLYSDGVRDGQVILDESDGWTYTFTNLPKYNEDGKRIKYTVREENIPKNYSVSYSTTWLGKVIVTNTYGEESNPATGAPGLD